MCCLLFIFSPVLFISPVDSELGGGHQYLDEPIHYPAEEGKRSPTFLIPVCKVFYLHTIQIYFAAPIVACGTCLQFPSTAPSMTSAGLLRIARAVLVVYA